MEHYTSPDSLSLQNAWLSIGTFDGVHLGHQEILNRLCKGAKHDGVSSVVITFFPHPAVVLGRRGQPLYLSSPDERAKLMGDLGVDFVITYPFTKELAQSTALEFVRRLFEKIHFTRLVVGDDFALGKNREGDVAYLTQIGNDFGFSVIAIPPVTNHMQVISSSQIRSLIASGNVSDILPLLGRYYSVEGEVVTGDRRGKKFNIPTANLEIWEQKAIPKEGVYASSVRYKDICKAAVTNIGKRPTFERSLVTSRVETHILDFHDDIYGEAIQLEFIQRLRDEKRFDSVTNLVKQINTDIAQTRDILIQV